MSARREFLSYIGTGAIGGIIGFYAGAEELLGIQSEVPTESKRAVSTETIRTGSTGTMTATTISDDSPTTGAGSSETEPETTTEPRSETSQVSFETASVGAGEPADPWTIVNDPYPNYNSVEISDQHPTHGSQALHMSANGDLENLLVGVMADVSDVASVLCDTYIVRSNHYNGFMNFGSWNGDEVNRAIGFQGQTGGGAGNDVTGEFTNLEGDLSEWTGEHLLVFNVQGDNEAHFDNLRFFDENGDLIPLAELNLSSPST